MRNINNRDKVNLYAVTHHFPQKLFSKFKDTKSLECIIKDRVYDLKIFTPVRFIISNNFDHPILGLFSNKTEQIEKSLERLNNDGWLLDNVSTYLNELYKHYSLEGVDMPYTREMFLKDHYPDVYNHFILGQQKGRLEGRQEGELIGNITALQKILKYQIASRAELEGKSISELQEILKELEKQIN
ncbi:hypothetical protein MTBBW1_870007 [Desulfamplus magnetovallimortis]|uniref:Uncharacterized protein n=1 Tax=Desulfamplus magnetovallimortis TaxID=1246637 RepID=A0A1W1HKX5_9BACT|nr:hypothetical protein [Desulfamplus magnetovallimortis]SLM33086.1 hypothetical protein MTBBW1_870007 [Desulfamplus magnetovallimortis]